MSLVFDQLIEIFAKLRDPDTGCPWDLKQTPESLQEYIIEEAHELIEAITGGQAHRQQEELGDLLLQIIFLSRIMEERGDFTVTDVMNSLKDKLIRRHPHIFSNVQAISAQEVKNNWEKIKKDEKNKASIISDYPDSMPALSVSKRIGEQAASVGFDWPTSAPVFEKIAEEIDELKAAVSAQEQFEECGDLLFGVVNLCRHFNVHPEMALKAANKKFIRRFRQVENQAREHDDANLKHYTLSELDTFWEKTKLKEREHE